jgi:hypothetical protein
VGFVIVNTCNVRLIRQGHKDPANEI